MAPACSAVQAIYGEMTARENAYAPAVARWQSGFERLHGPMERKRRVDRRSVARVYGLRDNVSLPHLLFAVETFLALYLVGSIQTLTGA